MVPAGDVTDDAGLVQAGMDLRIVKGAIQRHRFGVAHSSAMGFHHRSEQTALFDVAQGHHHGGDILEAVENWTF